MEEVFEGVLLVIWLIAILGVFLIESILTIITIVVYCMIELYKCLQKVVFER